MPQTPQRFHGTDIEDDLISFNTSSNTSDTQLDGEIRYVSGSGFRVQEQGYIRVLLPYSNFTASIAPTVNDDSSKNYSTGSLWVDGQNAYVLLLPTIGAAVWKNFTSGAFSSQDHKTFRHLIHFINEGPGDGFYANPFREIESDTSGKFTKRETWWSDSNKTIRLYQTEVTRSGIYPMTQKYKMYASDGITILNQAVDVISYQGAFETARSRSFV